MSRPTSKAYKVKLVLRVIRETYGRRSVEVGEKTYEDGTDSYDCSEAMMERHGEYDLCDLVMFCDLPAADWPEDGELDLYVYTVPMPCGRWGRGTTARELETNVSVFTRGGRVIRIADFTRTLWEEYR